MMSLPKEPPRASVSVRRALPRCAGCSASASSSAAAPQTASAAAAATATATGDDGAADASARGLLRLLHALESATERGVGTLSENVLEALEASDETAADAIAALRRATKQASMQKAMERREKMLKEMGLTRLSPTPSGVDAYGSASCSPSPRADAAAPTTRPGADAHALPCLPSTTPELEREMCMLLVTPRP